MPQNSNSGGRGRALTKVQKFSLAGVATLGAAALAFTLVPGSSGQTTTTDASSASRVAYNDQQIKDVKAAVTDRLAAASLKAEVAAAKKKAAADARAAAAKKKAAQEAAAKKAAADKAAKERKARQEAASRSTTRAQIETVAAKTYANNLDGWIRQALDIMAKNGIPGTYNGLYRNIMRESSGNPSAVNGWDTNAVNGTPSIGLLQVIQPTFNAYHVSGTSTSIYDPVANITAAANYAAAKYGSIDNVNGAY
ncbi:Lytic transglycosylase catalytic [Actinobacteria bacterium OK074]|nr:Lytic transglycosylase catalytic [Actinobacteria bacterium OK074]